MFLVPPLLFDAALVPPPLLAARRQQPAQNARSITRSCIRRRAATISSLCSSSAGPPRESFSPSAPAAPSLLCAPLFLDLALHQLRSPEGLAAGSPPSAGGVIQITSAGWELHSPPHALNRHPGPDVERRRLVCCRWLPPPLRRMSFICTHPPTIAGTLHHPSQLPPIVGLHTSVHTGPFLVCSVCWVCRFAGRLRSLASSRLLVHHRISRSMQLRCGRLTTCTRARLVRRS